MHNPEAIAREYLAVWNQPDAERRQADMAQRWTDDARYADPMMAASGRDAIGVMIEQARAQFPGHAFALRGQPDSHRDFVRFSWTLAPADGTPVGGGTDVVRLDADGRIAEVIGFLDGA
jgi:hypothetical protein